MNIQKIVTVIALTTGLGIFNISAVSADPRKQQVVTQYESHHHQNKKKHYKNRYNRNAQYNDYDRYRPARKIRHERNKRIVSFKIEHRYQHKNGIPHRNTLGAAHPHKSWRKQHKRWNYAALNRKYERRTSYRTQPHSNQYSFISRYWH